jgi:hypothetical protein
MTGTDRSKCILNFRFVLSNEEKNELIAGLKQKWEIVHKEYQ